MNQEELTHNNVLVLNGSRPNNRQNFTREPFLQYMQSLDRKIPKHIITLDEKYLRHCLELVYASATSRTSCTNVPEYLSSQISTFFEGTSSLYFESDSVNYFPLEAGIIENGRIATITRSKGGVNLPKSHLFQQSLSTKNGIFHGRPYLTDATKSGDDTVSTSSRLSISSLRIPEKKMITFESERFRFETKHEREVSIPCTYSLSGRSSFSLFGNLNRGMLQCTWKDGLPHFVFSLDDYHGIYIANIIKSETPNSNGFDYIYTFHTNEGYHVGKMRVSTLFKLCPNNSEIKETEFVLFGVEERDMEEAQTSIRHNSRKSKRLSNMMSEVFKSSHSLREKTSSRYALTNEKPFIDLSTDFSPNLESAAVIVQNHVCVSRQEPEARGWGMNFLKKVESKNTESSKDPSTSLCDCSPSTNILIPANFHGGPHNKTGGPSSLVERWRCGGKCDCGGWDTGCPITVLDSERSKEENSSQTDIRVAGLQDSDPMMKMVNIRDDLYVIYFESTLSALQSLSIAVSIIHSQSIQ